MNAVPIMMAIPAGISIFMFFFIILIVIDHMGMSLLVSCLIQRLRPVSGVEATGG